LVYHSDMEGVALNPAYPRVVFFHNVTTSR
jgi:hypothetical protein